METNKDHLGKNKKCYIAGKIGDLPQCIYLKNFNDAKLDIYELGYVPVSPTDLHTFCTHDFNWLEFMRCDLTALLKCDALFALNNWKSSPGATIEVNLAIVLGLTVIYQQ